MYSEIYGKCRLKAIGRIFIGIIFMGISYIVCGKIANYFINNRYINYNVVSVSTINKLLCVAIFISIILMIAGEVYMYI